MTKRAAIRKRMHEVRDALHELASHIVANAINREDVEDLVEELRSLADRLDWKKEEEWPEEEGGPAMTRGKSVLAWHIIPETKRLGYGDGRAVLAGQKLTVDVEPRLCKQGLHASIKLLDALGYAKEPIVCRVRFGGTIVRGNDKLVATERTCLWMVDATKVFREFACWAAERALKAERERGREPDARSWKAIQVARAYGKREATLEQLREARCAAYAYAAADAAADAADAAAAADAAYAAAYAADAADAAYAAYARSGARQKERDTQNKKLEAMVTAEHKRLARKR